MVREVGEGGVEDLVEGRRRERNQAIGIGGGLMSG